MLGFRGVYTLLSEQLNLPVLPWGLVLSSCSPGHSWCSDTSSSNGCNRCHLCRNIIIQLKWPPPSACGVQTGLLGFRVTGSALGASWVLWMSQCWKNDIDFKPGTCWMLSWVLIPASQEHLACTSSAAGAAWLFLSPPGWATPLCACPSCWKHSWCPSTWLQALHPGQSWFLYAACRTGCEHFARSPQAVLCSSGPEAVCSEAAKLLVFSVMIKMQRNECICVYI